MQKLATEATNPLRLGGGQTFVAQLPRGAVLHVAGGAVTVAQRIALDHFTMVLQTPLLRGGVHHVDVAGWVEMVAQSDAELFVRVPQTTSLAQGLRAGVGMLLAWVSAGPAKLCQFLGVRQMT